MWLPTADVWVVIGGLAGVLAAVCALIALVYQLRKDRREAQRGEAHEQSKTPAEESPVRLNLCAMYPTFDNGHIGDVHVGLTLVNHLDHPINWTNASISLQDQSGRHLALIDTGPPEISLPKQVGPHDSDFTMVPFEVLEAKGFDMSRPITAFASLATGEKIVSEPWTGSE